MYVVEIKMIMLGRKYN